MKKKLIIGFFICVIATITNLVSLTETGNSKLEFIFDKIEALAAGENLDPADVICSGNGEWGRCYDIQGQSVFFWCKWTGFTTDICPKPL